MSRITTIALATAVFATTLALSTPADAGGRYRARSGSSVIAGGSTNAGGAWARSRNVSGDGSGNVSGQRNWSATGANGGSAEHASSAYRNADGSAGRSGSTTVNGANGGSMQTGGSMTRTADGLSGSHATSATGPNGATYTGSSTYAKGEGVSHTGTCTDAAGNVVPCH